MKALKIVKPAETKAKPVKIRSPLGVVEQVRIAIKPQNRMASCFGFAFGGFVPLASYWLAHYEVRGELWSLPALFVVGGLLVSAKTIFQWSALAFADRLKAFGYVLILEGVCTFAETQWLAIAALTCLIFMNGVAAAVNLATKPGSKSVAE